MAITVQNWFSSWFDTPYYLILSKVRGYAEAEFVVIDINMKKAMANLFPLHEGFLYNFPEKVKSLTLYDVNDYFSRAGIRLKKIFGNYQLEEYNGDFSARLILISQ